MKKSILFLSLIFICSYANALSFTIVSTSFDESTAIQPGSQQYIDIKADGSNSTSDSIRIFITHNGGNMVFVFRKAYWNYYPTLTDNSDGSKRLYFNMPSNYLAGNFTLTLLNSIQNPAGVLASPSAVINPTTEENRNKEFDFYSQSGIFQRHCKYTDLTSGFYISNGFKFIKD